MRTRSTSGSVAVIVAISLTMLIGFSALGSEVVFALFKQRQMQAAASAAAFAGAVALATLHPAVPATEARAVAASAGFVSGTAGTTVTVNIPPLSGTFAGTAAAVEVIVTQPQSLPLSSMFRAGLWNISARAVATAGSSGSYCVLELDGSNYPQAVLIGNGANLTLDACGLGVNSHSSSALEVNGGAKLTANAVSIVGDKDVNNGGSIVATNGVATNQPAVADPYASIAVPTVTGCTTYTDANQTLNLGHYCGGISIGNGHTVSMNPGIYIVEGTGFSVQGGSNVTGTGVTIVLTGSGTTYATVSIGNGANVTLSAPTTGATKGLVFFGDPAAPHSNTNNFQGGSKMNLTGALYFPSQAITYENGSTNTSQCTQLLAWHMSFQGGSKFSSICGAAGTAAIGGGASALVE